MADPGMQPPYLDPSQYPAYLDVQRKQMLANALMQTASQSTQTPQGWDQMRVVPRRSMLSNITPLVGALLGRKAWDASQQAQQKYFQGMMGGGQPSPASQQSAPPPDAAPQPTSGLLPPNGDPTAQGPPSPAAAPSHPAAQASLPMASQGNPMLLTGDPRTSNALLSMMGPGEYAKALAGRYAPTDMERTLRAAGIDPASPIGQQTLRMSLVKQNYIAPVGGARPGTIAFDPTTGQPLFAQPDVAHNVQLGVGQDGQVSAAPIPGNVAAQAALQGAETAAKVSNTPQTFPTAGGGSTVGYPSDMLGAPPAMRGGSPAPSARPQPAVPQGAGQTAPVGSAQGPGSSAAAQPAAAKPADLWSTAPKLRIGTSIGAPDSFTQGRLQEAGKKDAELSSQYGKEADLADQKLQYNTEASKVLGSAETGPSSEWLTENRAKLIEWGVPESLVPGSGKITPTMELNKNLKQSALQGARAIFGSRMTQMEVRLQHEELSPSTSMTKDAIASLMQQDNIKQMYAKQRADDYGKYVQQGGDPLRFESWYAKSFPLTKFAQSYAQPGSSAPSGASSQTPVVTPKTTTSTQKPWEMNWK